MQWLKLEILLNILFILVISNFADIGDPYKILNIGRKATLQEIRRAYKQLAKEWHPDKSDDPSAEAKFVEIKQAYELLIDPERRKAFDLHGITNEDNTLYKQRHDYSQYGRFAGDPFENLFGSHGGRFHFNGQDMSIFHKMSVTSRQYELNLVPKSHQVPHLLMFYADLCFSCIQAVPIWRRLIDSLEPLGIVLNTVHSSHELSLTRNIGVHSLPCIVLLLDGSTFVYKDTVFNVQKVVEFVKLKLPYKLIAQITDNNVEQFLSGWPDNRVRALVMEPRPQPRLRYLVTAFRFRKTVAFGFVCTDSDSSDKIRDRYKINRALDTVLMFNEDHHHSPVVSITMSDIPTDTLRDVISANQYLALPRLSDQQILDALCPAEWNRAKRKLCVVLVTDDDKEQDGYREALRQVARRVSGSYHGRVRFTYVFREKQRAFVDSLLLGPEAPRDELLKLVIIWRRDTTRVMYDWFDETWVKIDDEAYTDNDKEFDEDHLVQESNYNKTRQRLEEKIQYLLRSTDALQYEAVIKDLLDEHAQGLISKVFSKLALCLEIASDHLTHEHIMPAVSVVGTVLFILAIGHFMAGLVKAEEERVQQENMQKTKKHSSCSSSTTPLLSNNNNNNTVEDDMEPSDTSSAYRALYQQRRSQELKLHELLQEKYNGLVRLLKPGCRTIVLLCDVQSRKTLLPAFHKAVWPYRRNKTLMFAHATLDKCLGWYRSLLEMCLLRDMNDDDYEGQQFNHSARLTNINPRNCVGTVLALNGHRRYFCVYHAMHPECNGSTGSKRMQRMSRSLRRGYSYSDPEAGAAFLGLDSDTSEGSSSDDDISGGISRRHNNNDRKKVLLEENLLDGLPNWLERLFEGTTHRYQVGYWPDFTAK